MPKTKAFLSALLVAVMVSGLAFAGVVHFGSAQSNTATSTPAAAASGGNGNLTLTLSVDETVLSLGEPVNLTLTITNVTNRTINFEHTGLDFDFEVTNDTNNQVYQWSNFKAIPDYIAIVPLDPGDGFSANFTWPQTCNFNLQVQGEAVSPGTYSIIGLSSFVYEIQTKPIQLTITSTPTSTPTPNSTPSATPVPTPTQIQTPTPTSTIPEFPSTAAILTLLIAASVCIAALVTARKRKLNSETEQFEK